MFTEVVNSTRHIDVLLNNCNKIEVDDITTLRTQNKSFYLDLASNALDSKWIQQEKLEKRV